MRHRNEHTFRTSANPGEDRFDENDDDDDYENQPTYLLYETGNSLRLSDGRIT